MFRRDDLRIIFTAVLGLLLLSFIDARADETYHQVYSKLEQHRPDMDRLTLSRIASTVKKYAEKYGQDPVVSIAIGMQETGLRQVERTKKVIVFNPDGITWRVEKGATDVCMFQFHVDTIINHNLDPIKLKDNLDYCVEQHFKLIKLKRNLCSDLGEDAWTCYHSKNPRLRESYKKLVARFL